MMSKSEKQVSAGGNPRFDERMPDVQKAEQKKKVFAGVNPLFDERKIVQAVKKIAEISEGKENV
jgi:hypothetical protein